MNLFARNKKGQAAGLNTLPTVVVAIVIGFVALGVGALVVDGVQDTQFDGDTATCNETGGVNTGCSAAYNASGAGLSALGAVSDFGVTMGTVAAAAILLALIGGLGVFLFRRG